MIERWVSKTVKALNDLKTTIEVHKNTLSGKSVKELREVKNKAGTTSENGTLAKTAEDLKTALGTGGTQCEDAEGKLGTLATAAETLNGASAGDTTEDVKLENELTQLEEKLYDAATAIETTDTTASGCTQLTSGSQLQKLQALTTQANELKEKAETV